MPTIGDSVWWKIQTGALWSGVGLLIVSVWWFRGFVADNHEFQVGTTSTMTAIVVRLEHLEKQAKEDAQALKTRADKEADAFNLRYADYVVWKDRTTEDARRTREELSKHIGQSSAQWEQVNRRMDDLLNRVINMNERARE